MRTRRVKFRAVFLWLILSALILTASGASPVPVSAADDSAWSDTYTVSDDTMTASELDDALFGDSGLNDYTTEQFDVTATATEDHRIHFSETIAVNFLQPHHGIERNIPIGTQYKIENASCRGYTTNVTTENDQLLIQVGDADQLLTGRHTYRISYDLVYYMDEDLESDHMYLDLLPTGWQTPIKKSSISLTMPKDVSPDRYSFYGGSYGSSSRYDSSSYTVSDDGREIHMELTDIPRFSGVTINAELPNGYWQVDNSRDIQNWAWLSTAVLAISLLAFFLFGRRGHVVETVEFYPPNGITPAEAGFIIDGTLQYRDLNSMVLYFAAEGYLHIHEYAKGKFELIKVKEMGSEQRPYARALFYGLFTDRPFPLLFRLFESTPMSTAWMENGQLHIKLDDLPYGFGRSYSEAIRLINRDFRKHPVYTRTSRFFRWLMKALVPVLFGLSVYLLTRTSGHIIGFIIAALLCTIGVWFGQSLLCSAYDRTRSDTRAAHIGRMIGGILLSAAGLVVIIGFSLAYIVLPALSQGIGTSENIIRVLGKYALPGVLFAAASVSLVITCVFMPRLRKKIRTLYGKLLGFRTFIKTAEYDRMKELSDSDPEYYYKTMPYAQVMGMSTQFAEKFSNILLRQPKWYSGYDSSDTTFDLNTCDSFCSTLNSTVASYTSYSAGSGGSGSSDSGGGSDSGGSSGGGGGGGGGGAW